jgi:hypothetical protein
MKMRTGETEVLANQMSLRRAALTLRAIRQRYETGHNAHPCARCYSVNIAIDGADMGWITAAIEAVEEAAVGVDTFEAA